MRHRISASVLGRLPVSVARRIVHKSRQQNGFEERQPKQLLVDISEMIKGDARTGIQRVVRGILLPLLAEPPEGYWVIPVFAERNQGYRYASLTGTNLQVDDQNRQLSLPVAVAAGDVFLGLDLAAHLIPRHQGQLLQWKRQGLRISFLVYDLLPLLHPYWFKPVRQKIFGRWLKALAIYADDLVCISGAVKNDLQNWLSTHYKLSDNAIRLHIIPLGADLEETMPTTGCTEAEIAALACLQAKQFVLMVGTLEPRKGYADALEAFEQLWADGHQVALVIVGKPGWKTEPLQERLRNHPECHNRLYWFESASDELLQNLYKAANGVILASEAEGFGLPLIEALRYGKPVLARDIPVYREVGKVAPTFFNQTTFVDCLAKWLLMISCCVNEQATAHAVTWKECSTHLIGVISKQEVNKNDKWIVNVR